MTLKGVKIEHVEKVLIIAVLFDVASMIAKMAARMADVDIISEDEDDAIRHNIVGAQSKIASLLECDSTDINLAAELCSDIPSDVIETAKKLSGMGKIDLDFNNEAEA